MRDIASVAIIEVTSMINRTLEYEIYAEAFLMPPIMDMFANANIRTTRFKADLMSPKEINKLITDFDAFVLMGGEDVHPSFYQGNIGFIEEAEYFTVADANQISVVLGALKNGKKVFGICRGLQVINVAMGGTLTQHLDNANLHRILRTKGERIPVIQHSIVNMENTLAHKYYGVKIEALTAHHQAVENLGTDLSATAYAEDGVIEAIEHNSGLLFGVQFHPEHIIHSDILLPPIIKFFLED
jgi:putative glutamine amidotransferase